MRSWTDFLKASSVEVSVFLSTRYSFSLLVLQWMIVASVCRKDFHSWCSHPTRIGDSLQFLGVQSVTLLRCPICYTIYLHLNKYMYDCRRINKYAYESIRIVEALYNATYEST